MDSNKVYIYFSHLLLDFLARYKMKDKDKFHLKFEQKLDVDKLYESLRTQASHDQNLKLGIYSYNDYETYYLAFAEFKVIIAASANDDFLTGLRNNFFKQPGFESNTAILFIHNTELESINKGVLNISMQHMPFAYENIAIDIVNKFSNVGLFSKTQCDFIDILLKAESNDYHIENTNIFDLSKYLNILVKEKLTKDDFENLKLFHDDKILNEEVPSKELRKRVAKNQAWHSQMSMHESVGSLESYIEKTFGKENVNKLKNKDSWKNYSLDDLLGFEANKGNIKFNEFVDAFAFSEEELTLWDRADGDSVANSNNRNIIVFNPKQERSIILNLKFRRKVIPNFLSDSARVDEIGNSLLVNINLATGGNTSFRELTYKDEKNGKFNRIKFKVLIVPFGKRVLSNFETKYLVKTSKNYSFLEISSEEDLSFNPGNEITQFELKENFEYEIDLDKTLKLELNDSNTLDKSEIKFQLKYGAIPLSISLKLAEVKPLKLTGSNAWLKKNQSEKSFLFFKRLKDGSSNPTITLEHGTSNYYPFLEFRHNLILEEQIIDNEIGIGTLSLKGELSEYKANYDKDLKELYLDIIRYYKSRSLNDRKLLPSLAYIDETVSSLYRSFLNCYLEKVRLLKENEALPKEQQDLLKIGTVYKESNKRLYLGPLHPLMLAYQLNLKRNLDEVFLSEPIDSIIKRLTPINLLPFINKDIGTKDYYIAAEQEHSLEWIEYIDASLEGQSLSRRKVPEMIATKIAEFTRHFSYLFLDNNSPIKINLINGGDCKESLKGIFNYFSASVKGNLIEKINIEEIRPIHINIYGSNNFVTSFEHFSKFQDEKDIYDIFEIDLTKFLKEKITSSDLLDLYHKKVQFSIKKHDLESDYAHITFYQFEEKEVEKSTNNINTIPTGINLEAVLNDLPSVHANGNYRTSFGLEHLNYKNDLINLSQSLNAIAQINNSANIYNEQSAFSSVINSKVREKLEVIYKSSQWVTFINPRVDLSFFKEDKDVVIIHYADQFGNSTGYDSITVTTKWEQYQFAISEHLKGKVQFLDNNIKHIINMFNAINGYWLLKLGSQTNYVEREKISILSAFKEAFAILHHPNITWVGLSLEEVLRVTGGSGLKQNDPNALFSIKSLQKSGSFSDDLLMVGIEKVDDDIQLYFYPIEVKLGKNTSQTIEKAIIQAKNTFNLIYNTLNVEGFTGKVFRNYLCNLILNSAQKLALYEVWPEYTETWQQLNELRGKLLNDNFKIGTLEPYIGEAGIISFKNNEGFGKRKIDKIDNCLVIDLYDTDGLNDLVKSVEELKNRYISDTAIGITKNDLLFRKYNTVSNNFSAKIEQQPQNSQSTTLIEKTLQAVPANQSQKDKMDNKTPLKITFGTHANTGSEINWYPTSTDRVMHTNTGIIGTMGTGKTQFNKSLITQLTRNQNNNVDGKPIGILIFDYKGDYTKDDFVEATNAKVYELADLPYNPLALSVGKNPKRKLPIHVASTFIETISKAYNLGNVQALELQEFVNEAYSNRGIFPNDPDSWGKAAPTLADVFELYLSNDKVKKDSLFAALNRLDQFGIFEEDSNKTIPLYDLIEGVTVINLHGYSNEIQTLVVAITLDLFYAQMQIHGHSQIKDNFRQITKMILVDEADNFLSKDFDSLRKILKEGREYGVGTILSTQFLNHFSTEDNDYSNYILTWIIHRVPDIKERDINTLFDIQNKKERDELIGEIKNLEQHYSIVNLAGSVPNKNRNLAFFKLLEEKA